MHIDLTGKTAIVSGSTAGIGLAIAAGLGESGAHVVVNGRTEASVAKALEELRTRLPDAQFSGVAADLGTEAGAKTLLEAHPQADILVNNLGIYGSQDFFETDDDVWRHYFEVNILSAVRLSRHYLPGMEENGWGRVVFIASESAFNIPADMIHYGFSKTALVSIARGLAKRMAGTGVTVNSVLPGPTLSDGMVEMLKDEVEKTGKSPEDAAREFILENRPSSIIQRAATVEEVANMVVYSCSIQASATTGAALRVDGGVVDSL